LKTSFLFVIAGYDVLLASIYIFILRSGNPKLIIGTLLCTWLSSLIPMAFVGQRMEHRTPKELFDPKSGSWMFIFGDGIFLPISAVAFAVVWESNEEADFGQQWWWLATATLLGIAAGIVFHALDKPNYDPERFSSPTKLVHDYGAYPLLAGGLMFSGVPALVGSIIHHSTSSIIWCTGGATVGVGGWVLMGAINHEFTGGLDTKRLHPRWKWEPPVGVITRKPTV
jgi:hypothetical protein